MRRFSWLLLLFAAAPGALFPQDSPRSPAERVRKDLEVIGSFHPRREGSPGEAKTVEYIESRLSSLGIGYSVFDFSESDFQHSFSSCIRAELPGTLADAVILAVPLNQPLGAAMGRDGAVTIALALELLRERKENPTPISLIVLFLGAEFGDTPDYPMGSTLFLRSFQPAYRAAVFYLNLVEIPSLIVVRGGGRGIVSPIWLTNLCVDSLTAARIPFILRGNENQIFRMGLSDEPTSIEPYLNAGWPALGLEGEGVAEQGTPAEEWVASFSSFLLSILKSSPSGFPETWDRHYLLFQAGSYSLIIRERTYVWILLSVLSGTLLFSLVFQKGLRKYLRALARNLPAILPLAGIAFLFLLVATFVLEGILFLRHFPALWTYAPLEFLALKLSIPLFLYGALYNFLRRLPFPRGGSFYTAAALLFLLVDIVVVAAFNVSFTYYFLWAFLFIFFSALVPNRIGKMLLFLPAPYWGVRGLLEVFQLPALSFCRFVLLSPIWGNLLIAGVSLPFILVLIRLGRLFPGIGILRRKRREVVLAVAMLASAGALAVHLIGFFPYSRENPQPLAAIQTIDEDAGTNTLLLSSPAPMTTLSLMDATSQRDLVPMSTEFSVPLPPAAFPLQASSEWSESLGRRNVSLLLTMPSSPRLLTATLTSMSDFILFDSSFPFVRESPRRYRILIGAFPPNPLPLILTFPAGGAFTLTLTVSFDSPLVGIGVTSGDARVTSRVIVKKSLELES